jgi:hypothetical protein
MKNILFILTIITFSIVLSCQNHSSSNTQKSLSALNVKYDMALFDGAWGVSDSENANFYIVKDSMYFLFGEGAPCLIKLSNDTLIIYYDGLTTYNKILKLDQDSMVLFNKVGGIERYKKRK